MNFDRREWLAVIAAGATKLFGVPGESMAELPEDDEEFLPSEWCVSKLLNCDACHRHFSYKDLDNSPGAALKRMPGRNVWLCDECAWNWDGTISER